MTKTMFSACLEGKDGRLTVEVERAQRNVTLKFDLTCGVSAYSTRTVKFKTSLLIPEITARVVWQIIPWGDVIASIVFP